MELLFSVATPLGKHIRTTDSYWRDITTFKHPQLKEKLREVELALIDPDTIRKSRSDQDVYLHYRSVGGRILCVVAKYLNGEGYVVTAYFTDKIKEGTKIWERKR